MTRPAWVNWLLSCLTSHLRLLFLVAVGGMLCWRGLFGRNQLLHAPGPVAAAHAVWETNCEACHIPNKSLNGHSWTAGLLGKEGDSSRCEVCHAGPQHHPNQHTEPACASCHQEHKGREHQLTRIADRHCQGCHREIAAHSKGDAEQLKDRNVISFEKHPEFRLQRENLPDRGALTFSHARHMTPGMVLTAGGKPAVDAHGDPLKLECAACHRLDARGAYMQPVSYEVDCRDCHVLTLGNNASKDLLSPQFAIPHGLQPDDIHRLLEGTFLGRHLAGAQPDLAGFLERPFVTLPGKQRGGEPAVRAILERQLNVAETLLYEGSHSCGECHQFVQGQRHADWRVVTPNVKDVWYEKARFSHAAHRALDCRGCHENAYPDGPKPSKASSDVLIPGLDNCKQCHGPGKEGIAVGRASGTCVECHAYHEVEKTGHGRGSPNRDPKERLDVKQFLEGDGRRMQP